VCVRMLADDDTDVSVQFIDGTTGDDSEIQL
jgi:hypothetical protein